MNFVYDAVVVIHFLGLASLIGGFLVQMKSDARGINAAMFHGALTQLVTGIILVGIREGGLLEEARELDMTKISIKLAISAIVMVVVWLGRRKPAEAQQAYWAIAGALSIVNVVVAVFV